MLTLEGEASICKMIFQGDVTDIPLGGNWYIGACAQVLQKEDTLASIVTEPTVSNGYARIAIPRNNVGWPVIQVVDGNTRIDSLLSSFAAVGGDFDAAFDRLFLTNAAAGGVGILYGYSGAYSSLITLLNTTTQDLIYSFYP